MMHDSNFSNLSTRPGDQEDRLFWVFVCLLVLIFLFLGIGVTFAETVTPGSRILSNQYGQSG